MPALHFGLGKRNAFTKPDNYRSDMETGANHIAFFPLAENDFYPSEILSSPLMCGHRWLFSTCEHNAEMIEQL